MLVELLVVILLMGIVGGLVSDAIVSALHGQRDITARAGDLDSLRQAMERTTRDMRAAQTVVAAQPQSLELLVPTAAGGSRDITWHIVTTAAIPALVESETDTDSSGAATPAPADITVLANLDAANALFSYLGKANYAPTTPNSVNRTTCVIAAAPTTVEPRCVGSVGIDLNALLPGHPDLELTETVQLRNVT